MTEVVTVEEYQRRRGLWYAWLRNPSHKQTQGVLRKTFAEFLGYDEETGQPKFGKVKSDAFCCLGGACEVHHAETGWGSWDNRLQSSAGRYFGELSLPIFSDDDKINNSYTSLPEQTRLWLGMQTPEGSFFVDQSPKLIDWMEAEVLKTKGKSAFGHSWGWASIPQMLAGLNDGGWLTFPQIADWCERNPAGLWIEGTY